MPERTDHGRCAIVMPEPYRGQVTQANNRDEMWTVIQAATYFELPPLIDRVGQWAISAEGLHSLVTRYDIGASRLEEQDWCEHMEDKTWVNADEFSKAYFRAMSLRDAGYLS